MLFLQARRRYVENYNLKNLQFSRIDSYFNDKLSHGRRWRGLPNPKFISKDGNSQEPPKNYRPSRRHDVKIRKKHGKILKHTKLWIRSWGKITGFLILAPFQLKWSLQGFQKTHRKRDPIRTSTPDVWINSARPAIWSNRRLTLCLMEAKIGFCSPPLKTPGTRQK